MGWRRAVQPLATLQRIRGLWIKANGWTPCIELFALGQTPFDCLKAAKGTVENFGEKNILINYMR